MRTLLRAVRRWYPGVCVVVGYLTFVLAAASTPHGLSSAQADKSAVIAGATGLAVSVFGVLVLVARVVRWMRNTMPRPGDRALAARWASAALRAQVGATHLVFVRSARRFGGSGAAALCEPYPRGAPHSSWFWGRPAVAPGRWMHASGRIGGGRYGDPRVLYVEEVLETFPPRAPAVALRHRTI